MQAHFHEIIAVHSAYRRDGIGVALGINRIERQRRLAGAGKPGDDDELIARNLHIDVLEIMLARPLDKN